MIVLTNELKGPALDWVVAVCEGLLCGDVSHPKFCSMWRGDVRTPSFYPSTDWAHGGPIIEREGIELKRGYGRPLLWAAFAYDTHNNRLTTIGNTGATPLIAAMRCYVASKLGSEIDVPEELFE